jgi:glycosyltransferase involved in cell wall biosynthesis
MAGEAPPKISVIIPMRDEAAYIGPCLESVATSDLPAEQYEVIVVDGRSRDRSREIVLDKAASFHSLRLLDNPAGYAAAGVNLGIRSARGEYIVRFDAHSECPPQYLRACIEELEQTGAADVGGPIRASAPDTYLAQALALTIQHPFGVGNSRFRLGGSGDVDTVPFGAFRRELFSRLGYFREDLRTHEDFEFCARIRKAGERVYLSERLTTVYHHSPTLGGYLGRAWRYGVWVTVSWRVAPYSFALRHAIPMLFALALIAAAVAAGFHLLPFSPVLLILGLYFVVATVAALQLAWRHGWWYLPVLPILFFLRHLIYGLGSLVGIVYPVVPASRSTAPAVRK